MFCTKRGLILGTLLGTNLYLYFASMMVVRDWATRFGEGVTLVENGSDNQDEEQLTKDLAEELRCQAVNNLRTYQAETVRWWTRR
jgi:hypothetical protein